MPLVEPLDPVWVAEECPFCEVASELEVVCVPFDFEVVGELSPVGPFSVVEEWPLLVCGIIGVLEVCLPFDVAAVDELSPVGPFSVLLVEEYPLLVSGIKGLLEVFLPFEVTVAAVEELLSPVSSSVAEDCPVCGLIGVLKVCLPFEGATTELLLPGLVWVAVLDPVGEEPPLSGLIGALEVLPPLDVCIAVLDSDPVAEVSTLSDPVDSVADERCPSLTRPKRMTGVDEAGTVTVVSKRGNHVEIPGRNLVGVKVTRQGLERPVEEAKVVAEPGGLLESSEVIEEKAMTGVKPCGATTLAVIAVTLGFSETIVSYLVISPVIWPPIGLKASLKPKRDSATSSSNKPQS